MNSEEECGRGKWFLVRKTGSTSMHLGLGESEKMVIGSEDSDIRIQSPTVEGRHAILCFDRNTAQFILQDLEAQSGTFVNGKKMGSGHSLKLRDKDLIRFGFDSDLYQIRLEAGTREATAVGKPDQMEGEALPIHREQYPPRPTGSRRLEQVDTLPVLPSTLPVDGCDSGHGSSPSPSSPTKGINPHSRHTLPPEGFRLQQRTPPQGSRSDISDSAVDGSGGAEGTMCSPMAFTVDFGGPKPKSPFGISDSISKFAPTRHKRNLSLSRAERRAEGSEGEETQRTSSDSGDWGVRVSETTHFVTETHSTRMTQMQGRSSKDETPTAPSHNLTKEELANGGAPEDVQSGTGTYTVDLEEKDVPTGRMNILGASEEQPHTPSDTSLEWVREWAETASKHTKHQQVGKGCESETEFLLEETGMLVVSLEKSVSQQMRRRSNPSCLDFAERREVLGRESGVRRPTRKIPSKEPPSRATSALSDSEYGRLSQEETTTQRRNKHTHIPHFAGENRAAGIGRGDENRRPSREGRALVCPGARPSPPPARTPSPFARNDGGRFSLRAITATAHTQIPTPKTRGSGLQRTSVPSRSSALVPPPSRKDVQEKTKGGGRGKSLLATAKRSASSLTAKEVELANWNRRKSYDPLKAAAAGRKKPTVTKEADEEPGQRINPDGAASVSKSPSCRGLASSAEELLSDGGGEDELRVTTSMWPMGSGSLQRSLHEHLPHTDNASNSLHRQRHKFEALDSLVIATIHSLSNKVRTAARQLLQKIHLEQSDDENGALVEEMICQLKEMEGASPNRGPSRELSGTLRNLKKLEQVILVLDRILCGETDDS